ncbi:hypothetical protein JR334_11120 [Clostridia bacterium]|nr:hypothetical protein JR334_11120 [Clostridia bacterium]
MINYQERLQQLDQEAEELVKNLKVLSEKAVNLDQAQQSLSQTREQIGQLISEIKVLTEGSQSLIGKLDDINTSTILEKISKVDDEQKKSAKVLSEVNTFIESKAVESEKESQEINEQILALQDAEKERYETTSRIVEEVNVLVKGSAEESEKESQEIKEQILALQDAEKERYEATNSLAKEEYSKIHKEIKIAIAFGVIAAVVSIIALI